MYPGVKVHSIRLSNKDLLANFQGKLISLLNVLYNLHQILYILIDLSKPFDQQKIHTETLIQSFR